MQDNASTTGAGARGCGLPERVALTADVIIPALDLTVSSNGNEFDLEQIEFTFLYEEKIPLS